MATKRTDCHRPGAIVPANYRYVRSYGLSSSSLGMVTPPWGINCIVDKRVYEWTDAGRGKLLEEGKHDGSGACCVLELQRTRKFADHGGIGKCSVCGASFIEGDVWEHVPSGEHIHIGQICAPKYEMLADRSAYELERGRQKAATAVAALKAQKAEARAAFLAKHEGLEDALSCAHPIAKDIAAKFTQFCTLSEKQVAFLLKLHAEEKNPAAKPEAERTVPAPIVPGRQTFRGKVVSEKQVQGDYGVSTKITVKVQAEGGCWLAWGTCPAAILDTIFAEKKELKGQEVEITASLKPGRDAHFAIMNRPNGKMVQS